MAKPTEANEQQQGVTGEERKRVMEMVEKHGIRIKGCQLYQAVDGETEFSVHSNKPTRRREMYLIPLGLVLLKMGPKQEEIVIVGNATVAYSRI